MSKQIELKSITKSYQIGKSTYNALNNISLDIDSGEFVAIMGPSGSGKSTLLNIIAGIDRPTTGEVLVDGTNIASYKNNQLADYRSQIIGMVYQNFNLLPQYNSLENTNLALLISGIDSKEGKKESENILNSLGLTERLSNKPTELSGGEQQRVAIARALIKKPKIILADEPTGNLDSKTSVQIIDLLKELSNSGKTVIVVTHSSEIAEKTNRVVQMIDGRINEK